MRTYFGQNRRPQSPCQAQKTRFSQFIGLGNVLSSRRTIALPRRHALYSLFLLSFDSGVSHYSAMGKSINAPHRTGRADLPHPALPQISRNGRRGIQPVDDAGLWQRVVLQVILKARPVERDLLTSSVQPLEDQRLGHISESTQGAAVTADPIVLIVTSQLGQQDRPPLLDFG